MAQEKRYVIHNGVRVVEGWPERIEAAQEEPFYWISGQKFERVRYGAETNGWDAAKPCHDCAVVKGQLHVLSCDAEQCPKCREQCLSCDCVHDEDPVGED